jgi:hypothetical protein
MEENQVPIQFPNDFEEKLEAMFNSTGERIGWCLLCNSAIKTEADLIPGTNIHACEAGWALEAKS